jgi:hypothetical protein
MHYTLFDGVAFLEDTPAAARLIAPVKVEIGGIFAHAQLKSLDDVKKLLAAEVKKRQGNALVGFTYGQRSVGWFKSMFSLDDVHWYGAGTVAVVTPR